MRENSPRSPMAFLLLALVLLYAGILLLAPMIAIVGGAFAKGIQPVLDTFRDEDVIHAFGMTFFLAIGSVIINSITGLVLAWVLVKHEFRGKQFVDAIIDAPFVFSPVIIGYVLIVLFGREGWIPSTVIQIAFSWPGMLLATVFVSLPFVTREVQPVLAAMTIEQEEAAATIGAGRSIVFLRIILPQIWRGLLYGIVLTFARSVGEFGAVAVSGGAVEGVTETATLYVFRAINDRNDIGAYTVSIALGLLSIGILTAMTVLRRPDQKS